MLAGKATIGYEEEQDYYAEGAEEEWEWDPESELWLKHCRNQQEFRSEMSKVWQDWTHAEGLQHEYGSCEVLQVRTERAYWRELPSQQSEVCKFISVFEHWERFRCSQGQALQRKLNEEKVVAKERCIEVSAEGPQEEEQESGEAIMMPLISSQVSSSEGTCRLLDSGAVQVTGQHLRQILAEFGLLETLEGPPVDFQDRCSGRSWDCSTEIWFAKGVYCEQSWTSEP